MTDKIKEIRDRVEQDVAKGPANKEIYRVHKDRAFLLAEVDRRGAENERRQAEIHRHCRHIELLYDQVRRRADERDKAQIEVERLRASLKPFAQLYLWPDDLGEDMATLLRSEDHWCEATNEDADSDVFIKRRYIRAARAALEAKP